MDDTSSIDIKETVSLNEVSSETEECLDLIKHALGLNSDAQAVLAAIHVARLFFEHVLAGDQIAARSPNGEVTEIFIQIRHGEDNEFETVGA